MSTVNGVPATSNGSNGNNGNNGSNTNSYMDIKLAIGFQCLAWSFQLPYVPFYLQEELNASKVVIAAVMAMQVGIQVIVAPTALGQLPLRLFAS